MDETKINVGNRRIYTRHPALSSSVSLVMLFLVGEKLSGEFR